MNYPESYKLITNKTKYNGNNHKHRKTQLEQLFQTIVKIQSKAIISGNTVTFNYSYNVSPQKAPFVIGFTVQRGKAGDQSLMEITLLLVAIIRRMTLLIVKTVGTKPGDEALKESILAECKTIVAELTTPAA